MTKCYYSHSKLIYGTEQENQELAFLRTKFDKVICPNNDLGELGSMEKYLSVVRSECDVVVCSPYKGYLGRGQHDEVSLALMLGKKVFVLRRMLGFFFLVSCKGVEIVDCNDWKYRYAKSKS